MSRVEMDEALADLELLLTEEITELRLGRTGRAVEFLSRKRDLTERLAEATDPASDGGDVDMARLRRLSDLLRADADAVAGVAGALGRLARDLGRASERGEPSVSYDPSGALRGGFEPPRGLDKSL